MKRPMTKRITNPLLLAAVVLAAQLACTGTSAQDTEGDHAAPAEDATGTLPNEPLGERPEDEEDLGRIFLREATVLLEPGEVQLEFLLAYARNQVLNTRARQALLNTALRVGLSSRLEAFASVPLTWAEQARFNQSSEQTSDNSGLGDISAGLNAVLKRESATFPDVIGTLSLTEPTGDEPDLTDPDFIPLSGGRRGLTVGLTFIRSYDPAVVFGGIGFTYLDRETLSGVEIEGGHRYTYRFGTGFAINTQLTLSGAFSGAFQTKAERDGITIPSTEREPMTLTGSVTYRLANMQFLEPSVTFGLNEDAVDAILSLAYFFTF